MGIMMVGGMEAGIEAVMENRSGSGSGRGRAGVSEAFRRDQEIVQALQSSELTSRVGRHRFRKLQSCRLRHGTSMLSTTHRQPVDTAMTTRDGVCHNKREINIGFCDL